jgi:hypothetical protein
MMSDTPVASREAALRIALAARALNGLDLRALVGALMRARRPADRDQARHADRRGHCA